MATQLLKGHCAHTTARHLWRRRLCIPRNFTSARCSAIREAQSSLRKQECSASDILEQHLHTIESTEPLYHSFLSTDAAAARAQVIKAAEMQYATAYEDCTGSSECMQAQALDKQISSKGTEKLGALAGIPIAIKASFSAMHAGSAHQTDNCAFATVLLPALAGQYLYKRAADNCRVKNPAR